ELNGRLQELDGKLGQVGLGAALMIGVPNRTLPAAVAVRSSAAAGLPLNYAAADTAILQVTATGANGPVHLHSEMRATVDAATQLGFMFGQNVEGFQLGATVKYQQINLVDNSQSVGDFDAEDTVDEDQAHKEHTSLNIDLGLRRTFGANDQFVYAATIENLIPQDFKGATGSTFSMNQIGRASCRERV